jgi:hypothetical protein
MTLPATPALLPSNPLTSPAAERNKGAILAALQALLPPAGRLLEIAAGTGQHAVFCAAGLPGWRWQPSDPDPMALDAIAAWSAAGVVERPDGSRPLPALQLDVLDQPWPVEQPGAAPWDAIFCANMLHIAPWACCGALMHGAARVLGRDGLLITYGPYRVEGEATAPGNQVFDADLRARNPAWGLRWLHDITAQAAEAGLVLRQRLALPANNQILVFGHAALAA